MPKKTLIGLVCRKVMPDSETVKKRLIYHLADFQKDASCSDTLHLTMKTSSSGLLCKTIIKLEITKMAKHGLFLLKTR